MEKTDLSPPGRTPAFWAALGLCALPLLLGLTVLAGWYTGNTTLIQVQPSFVPMQYNTALGFLISGVALLAVLNDRKKAARWSGGIVAAIGILTLFQYITGLSLGIDQLLMEHYITTETSHPGRMAPNTALCFSLTGLTTYAVTRRDPNWLAVSILGSLVFGLGLVPFAGYMTGLETTYGWAALTKMAVHTSAGFIIIGIGILTYCWNRTAVAGELAPDWVPAPVSVALLTITICLWQALQVAEAVDLARSSILVFGLFMSIAFGFAIRFSQAAKSTASQLEDARDNLERRVEDRTQDLEDVQHSLLEMLQRSPMGVSIRTPGKAEVLFANERMLEIMEMDFETYASGELTDIATDPNQLSSIRESMARGGAVADMEMNIKTKDGKTRDLLLTILPITYQGERANLNWIYDITQRKEVEQELKDSRARFLTILENVSAGIVIVAQDGEVLYVNPRVCEMFDRSADEMAVENIRSLYVDKNRRAKLLDILDREGALRDQEVEFIKKDGETFWSIFSSAPIEYEGRQAILGSHFDITMRKKAEEKLKESEHRFRRILNTSIVAVAIASRESGAIVYANEAMGKLFNQDLEDFIGQPAENYYADTIARAEAIEEMARSGSVQDKDMSFLRRDGSTFEGLISLGLVEYEGAPGTIAWIFDITDRKLAETELKQKTDQIDILQQIATIANKSADFEEALESGLLTVCNAIGWPIGHAYVVSKDDADRLEPADIWFMEDARRFHRFRKVTMETVFEKGVGLPGRVMETQSVHWIKDVNKDSNFPRAKKIEGLNIVSGFGLPVIARSECVAVLEFFANQVEEPNDLLIQTLSQVGHELGRVKMRQLATDELSLARDAAEDAAKAKSAFLAAMSHEIRTPMNGVVGMVDLLIQTKLDTDQRQMLNTVRDSGHSLLTIINDILDFSKIEAGKLDIEDVDMALVDVVEGAAQTIAPNAVTKGVKLLTYVDPDIAQFKKGDPTRVRQIIINMGGNAIKFSEKGKEVLIRADKAGHSDNGAARVRFSIVDQGIGISKEAQASLFEEFSQADVSNTRKFGGTGLGLAICKRLTELMGGELGVDSVLGEGSTFWCELPFGASDKTREERKVSDLSGLRILVISQSESYREICKQYLHHWNAEIEVTTDIDECLQRSQALRKLENRSI